MGSTVAFRFGTQNGHGTPPGRVLFCQNCSGYFAQQSNTNGAVADDMRWFANRGLPANDSS